MSEEYDNNSNILTSLIGYDSLVLLKNDRLINDKIW